MIQSILDQWTSSMDQFIGSRRLLVATNQETIVTSEALLFRDLIKSKKKAKRLTTSFLQ